MKLNKKGFGVAEIAIVILLIGILAAAVIVGFMGIKNKANSHAAEEVSRSKDVINQTKHAYPTILSGDISRLEIKAGEYEVYELGGYSINGRAAEGKNYTVGLINNGTLYISGSGTLDKSIAINSNKPEIKKGYTAVENNGNLYMSDLVIIGGGDYYSPQDGHLAAGKKNTCYAFLCNAGETVLENIYFNTTNGGFSVSSGAKLTIRGTNTFVTNIGSTRTSSYLFVVGGTALVEYGEYRMDRGHNTYAWINGGTLTIKNGTFAIPDTAEPLYNGFYLSGGELNIEDGFFVCRTHSDTKKYAFFKFGSSATVKISGGEFITTPNKLVLGTGTIIITGGAFQWNPTQYLPKDGTYDATQKVHTCKDGVDRLMWVVYKK